MTDRPWQSLSDLVLEVAPVTRTVPADEPIREAAALVASQCWGMAEALRRPALVNVAALAVAATRGRLLVHQVRPAAAMLVDSTDLHSLPSEAPSLLRRPWILEARRPETGERLFGSTASLAGYEVDGATYLLGLQYPDGAAVARWTPHWTGEDIEAGIPAETSPLIADVDAHHEWAREAARFVIVLGLLLEADGAPLTISDEVGRATRGRGDAPAWSIRNVYLERPERRGKSGSIAGGGAPEGGRVAEAVEVRGHLRRQRHGPGSELTRWIYVASYEARRWVAPRARVVVGR